MVLGCGRLSADHVRSGVYHQVRRGQTLWSIAQAYGTDVATLVQANRLSNAHTLYPGQKLYIPGATQQRPVPSRCPCGTASPSAQQPRASPATSSSAKPAAKRPFFIWPIQGTVTRGFIQHPRQRHDGLDIAAPPGTLIRAAADGKVLFSDWGPGGYGRMVILRHADGFVTVYAHTQRNLVREGQFVRQGTPIATVGRSGRASGYHLHFEIRRRTVPVAPAKFLPPAPQVVLLRR